MSGYQLGYDVNLPPVTSTFDPPGAQPSFGSAFDAARRDAAYDASSTGKLNALSDAIDARNRLVMDATGVSLENPLNAGYAAEASARYLSENPDAGDLTSPGPQEVLNRYRMDAYQHALDAAQKDRPAIPGLATPLDDAARALADQAQADAARPGQDFMAKLAGGFAGSLRDPVNLAAMAVPVGGELRAASTLGRVFEGSLRAGAVNAGVTALQQPGVQKWRAERGQETGLLPAAEDVGTSFLYGLPFGAVHGVFAHAPAPIGRPADVAAAVAGDAGAARRLLDGMPAAAAPDLHAAILAHEADRAVMVDPPAGAAPGALAQTVREAVRFGEDPDASLPSLVPTAEAEPGAAVSQRLIDLSAEALKAMRDGLVQPEMAQHVAAVVADPTEHLAAVQRLVEAQPRSEADARAILTADVQNRTIPDATHALLGPDPEGNLQRSAAVPEPSAPIETPADAERQVASLQAAMAPEGDRVEPAKRARAQAKRAAPSKPQSLVSFIKAAGGIRDDGGELRAAGYHRRYIGVVNKTGRSLDEMRLAAAEQGYLGVPIDRAMADTTPSHLLDAMADHPRFAAADEPGGERAEALEAHKTQAAYEKDRARARRKLDATTARHNLVTDAEHIHDASRLMVEHGVDAETALERVYMMEEYQSHERAGADLDFDIPFDDQQGYVLQERSDAAPDGGDSRGGREQADVARAASRPRGNAVEAQPQQDRGGQATLPGVEPAPEPRPEQITLPGIETARRGRRARRGNAPPRPGGLFDPEARAQVDLFDAVPFADRADGADLKLGDRATIVEQTDLAAAFGRLVQDCRI